MSPRRRRRRSRAGPPRLPLCCRRPEHRHTGFPAPPQPAQAAPRWPRSARRGRSRSPGRRGQDGQADPRRIPRAERPVLCVAHKNDEFPANCSGDGVRPVRRPPVLRAARVGSGSRRSLYGRRVRLRAMPRPIVPRPIKATSLIVFPFELAIMHFANASFTGQGIGSMSGWPSQSGLSGSSSEGATRFFRPICSISAQQRY